MELGADPRLRGHAFISYVREDGRRVDRLEEFLKAHGVPVWRDIHDLWPGEDWRAKIREAIVADDLAFIACFSRHSEAREKSFQREELLIAIEQFRLRPPDRPYILPIRFDDCDIPPIDIGAGRTLNSLHHVDLFGTRRQASVERLLESIRHVLGTVPPTRRWSLSRVQLILAGIAGLAVIALAAAGLFRLFASTPSRAISGVSASRSPGSSADVFATGSPPSQLGMRVTDNSDALSTVVPQSWGAVVGNGWHPREASFNGSYIGPGLNATTNLGNWFDDLVTPGIFVGASKLLIKDHYDLLTTLGAFAPSCTFSSSRPVTADGLTGYRDVWVCQKSTTRWETVAMWPKDHSFIAFLEFKIVTPVDEADANRVLATLSIRY